MKNSSNRLEPAPGVLYVVGTPIGNLGDLSPRAEFLLKNVNVIACEDTRHSGQLLKKLGSTSLLVSLHQHNSKTRLPKILKFLEEDQSVALISDAGLPAISDPGEIVICEARKKGYEVICIPGPCAATTAIVSSGLPTKRFCFEGFLPTKTTERKIILESISKETRTTIIYESPHRLLQLLEELFDVCGGSRPLSIGRELTKIHEEYIGPNIEKSIEHFKSKKPQGEFTLVLGGAKHIVTKEINETKLLAKMKQMVADGLSTNEAARNLAKETGIPKRDIYSLFHLNQ